MADHSRRRVLCLRPRANTPAAPACAWTDALALQADVIVHEGDADVAGLCAAVRPDLIVLEELTAARPWPAAFDQPRGNPAVPRVLLMVGEPDEPLAGLSFRLADALGAEAVFVPGEAHRQHMPELAHWTCYFAPPIAGRRQDCEEGVVKAVPITVLDGMVDPGLNPWRTALMAALRLAGPFFARDPAGTAELAPMRPEDRARLIGRSWFCAADTTRLDRVGPDLLAIPAAGAVLLAPISDALAACGFVDGETCLLGSGSELVRRAHALMGAPADYERIRQAGMALVSGRSAGAPHPILAWFECRARRKTDQVIQQVGCYGPFRGVTPTASTPSVLAAPARDSAMTAALKAASAALVKGDSLVRALPGIEEATGWQPRMAQPLLLFSLFALLAGKPMEAAMGLGARAERLGACDERLAALDPVEAAWLMLIARLIGHAPLEAAMREQAGAVRHLSLRRMLWLLDDSAATVDPSLLERQPGDLPSVHWLGQQDFTDWADLLRRVLMANRAAPGQAGVARRLTAAA